MEIKTYVQKFGSYPNSKLNNTNATSTAARNSKTETAEHNTSGDTVTVSENARLRTTALATALSAEDVRAEKINEIKQRIASGNYNIDTKEIARKLLLDERQLFQ